MISTSPHHTPSLSPSKVDVLVTRTVPPPPHGSLPLPQPPIPSNGVMILLATPPSSSHPLPSFATSHHDRRMTHPTLFNEILVDPAFDSMRFTRGQDSLVHRVTYFT
ncbi:uncharacterized protein BT62DRAFT_1010209 [Guyanagaster necrorhizus]|uniref:Uncharacterized protein n=1 Tax=Guyanagaster necrorhizus TaxID=856835 RepID=A0A9P7VL69_9AGAR|nr:uncharacterized protein BT62DRAFT_1010209 [Guyanagaster necrorhizus MCA 3950]KAG7442598.1 hypothetical protein BT62DRAFT_1010209 [Guyanagaster necrorhizus MCA 3950]